MVPSETRVGAGVTPFQTDARATIRLAVHAEELGYARFGCAEGWTQDAVVVLGQIAGATSRIGLATTVLPVWSRTPGALLEGARLPLEREDVRALRLGAVPERPVPIQLAALAPASVRLAGELADQWLPFLWARSRISDGRALLAEGEAAAEAPRATGVECSVPLAIAEDEETAGQIAAGWLLAYLTRMGPIYPRMLRDRFGFAKEAGALLAANEGGGPSRLPAAAERMAREVTVMSTYAEAPQAVRLWLEAGADAIDLVLPPGLAEEQLREMLEAAAL